MLHVGLLGDVVLTVDGQSVGGLRSRRGVLLLALLAARPSARSRVELADLVWPDADPGAARAELSRVVYDLRRRIGAPLIATGRTLRLDAAMTTSDVALLDAAVRSADPARWREALAAVRGPFLADVDLDDRDADDVLRVWVDSRRSLHRAQSVELLGRLAENAAGRGEDEEALDLAHQALAHDPLDEATHRRVVATLARLGRFAAAAAHHQRLVTTLREEVGANPETATCELAKEVAREAARAAAAQPRARASLPRRVGPLVGRAALLARTRRALVAAREHGGLVTLTGLGGVGKTRLALELAWEAANQPTPRPVLLWVDLSTITDSALVLPTAAAVLRSALGGDTGSDPRGALVRRLGGAPALVVLDNLEQIPGVGPVVADLLEALPDLVVLATSRGPVRVRGERLVVVPPLSLDDAVALFDDLAVQESTDGRSEATVAVCEQLDGLPLAVELAAAQVRMLGVEGVREHLTRFPQPWPTSLDELPEPEADRPDRQRSLRRTVLWGAELLSGAGRTAFADVGAFAGAFTVDAAAAVLGAGPETMPLLSQLVDAGLLTPVPPSPLDTGVMSAPRFRMLPTVAALAREELERSGRVRAVRTAHAEHVMSRASASRRWGTDAVGQDQYRRLAELARDIADVRVALEHAPLIGPGARGRLVWSLWNLWFTRRLQAEGAQWAVRALGDGEELDPALRCQLNTMAAHLRTAQADDGFLEACAAHGQAAAEAAAEVPDGEAADWLRSRALLAQCTALLFSGQLVAARDSAQRALELQESAPDEHDVEAWLLGLVLLGSTAGALGDQGEYERCTERGWVASRSNAQWRPAFDQARATTLLQAGDAAGTAEVVAESLAASRAVQELSSVMNGTLSAAAAALVAGQPRAAARLLGACYGVLEQTGEPWLPWTASTRDAVDEGLLAALTPAEKQAEVSVGRAFTLQDIEEAVAGVASAARASASA